MYNDKQWKIFRCPYGHKSKRYVDVNVKAGRCYECDMSKRRHGQETYVIEVCNHDTILDNEKLLWDSIKEEFGFSTDGEKREIVISEELRSKTTSIETKQIIQKEKPKKETNTMRKFIFTVFLAVLAVEVLKFIPQLLEIIIHHLK